jgi:hypothetical protein
VKTFVLTLVSILSLNTYAKAAFSDMYGYNIRKLKNFYEVKFTPVFDTVDESNLAPFSNLIGHKLKVRLSSYSNKVITPSVQEQIDYICQNALMTDLPEITTFLGNNKIVGSLIKTKEEAVPLKGFNSPYTVLNDDVSEYCLLAVGENMSQDTVCFGTDANPKTVISEMVCTIYRQ